MVKRKKTISDYKKTIDLLALKMRDIQDKLDIANEKLKEKEKKDKDRYSAKVFCSQCGHVADVLIPNGVRVDEGDCTHCRVRSLQMNQTLFLVTN